jgi:hypothetical protein
MLLRVHEENKRHVSSLEGKTKFILLCKFFAAAQIVAFGAAPSTFVPHVCIIISVRARCAAAAKSPRQSAFYDPCMVIIMA